MALKEPESGRGNARLDSWKEIAAYLGRDERTVKRWEKTRGLPVRRLPGVRSGVFSLIEEIDQWQWQHTASPEISEVSLPGFVSATQASGSVEEEPRSDISTSVHQPLEAGSRPTSRVAWPLTPSSVVRWVSGFAFALIVVGVAWFSYSKHTALHSAAVSAPSQQVSTSTAHVPAKDVEDLYLNGRYFWNKRTPEGLKTALGLFQKAIQRDPDYAPAYIGLADTYLLQVEYAALPPRFAYPPAIEAAQHAIALAPSMSAAHRSLAFASFYWEWDRASSEREFREAVALDPHDATAHHWFANVLMTSMRYQEALNEIEMARELDPTAISILADRAHILVCLDRADEALDALRQIDEVDPAFMPVHWYLADIYYQRRDDVNYLRELKRIAAITHHESDSELYAAAERGMTANGEKGLYDALAEANLRLYRRGLVPAFSVGAALAHSGRRKEAIRYLKIAYLNRDTQFLTLQANNALPMLRDDPEFLKLARTSDHPYDAHGESVD